MKRGVIMRRGGALLGLAAIAAGCPAAAQQPGAQTVLAMATETSGAAQVVREIDDPHSGARWLLLRDREHPAGPGRLVHLGEGENPAGRRDLGGTADLAAEAAPALPVIRSGDRLIIEENTAVVEARLEAVALGPAAPGSAFRVRLTIGGRVARAVALGPGRAAFLPELEARP
jgi:hypothetical protein